ncbi:recombination regulator RecX [Nocardioides KLBMP 9356]|uniref:Regulatory protein RecX n=1 Tax=Nocardioides potassii TaxID=2911371 RepID=A0ABS9H8E3_9ACTN|nr:regulatory protein RecX [Nocardioides potassii]MCF6377492.1 recombination regulator RecX [Nocardioides potassii]
MSADEHRPPPDWVGDVSLGVRAWVGDTPPTPHPERSSGEQSSERSPAGRRTAKTGRRGQGRSRTKTWEERKAARIAREEAAAAEVEADPESVARTILLDSLTGQARTRKELADKLAKRGVPDELASSLLDRFTEVGLIDDSAYARQWVESRHRSRGLAPRALAQELRRKGVGDEEAKEALEQIGEDDQRAAARALVDRKLRSMSGLDPQVATRRLAGLLARKGYAAGLAFSVVREALAEQDADLDEPHPDF